MKKPVHKQQLCPNVDQVQDFREQVSEGDVDCRIRQVEKAHELVRHDPFSMKPSMESQGILKMCGQGFEVGLFGVRLDIPFVDRYSDDVVDANA